MLVQYLHILNNLPFVSIIILNYNKSDLLIICLQSLLNITDYKSYEIVIIDNGSTDDSQQVINKLYAKNGKIKIVFNDKNLGYAEGNNVGIKYISNDAKYVVILNNDTLIEEKYWLLNLVEFLEEHDYVGEAQPVILNLDQNPPNLYGYQMNVFGTFFPIIEISDKIINSSQQKYNFCFSALGAAIIVRRDIIDKIGLFNERFFLDYEDADLSWRIRLYGYSVVCVHSSFVCHMRRATVNSFTKLSVLHFHDTKNRLYMMLLNYDKINVVKYVPWVILLDAYSAMRDLIFSIIYKPKREYSRTKVMAVMKSFIYLATCFRDIWNEREYVQHNVRILSDSEIIGRNIINARPRLH